MTNIKVLIVEDQAITAMSLEDNLLSMGYVVTDIIDKGENVLKSVETERPDVILMDIILKGKMTGIEVAKKVESIFSIPIIYLTASSDEKTFKEAKITNAYGYIIKPFNVREVKINIEMALFKKESEEKLRKVEEKLRESELRGKELIEKRLMRLEDVFEATSDFIGMATKDGEIYYQNSALKSLQQNKKYKEIKEFYPTDALRKIEREAIPKALRDGSWQGENSIYDKNRDIIPISQIILAHKNEKDQLEFISTIARDISKSKTVEQTLQQSEERYKNFIQFSQEGIWRMEFKKPLSTNVPIEELATDILYEGSIVECNTAMAKMYGYTEANKLYGKRLIDLFDPENSEEVQTAIDRTKTFIENDFRIDNSVSTEKNKDGKRIYISNSTIGILRDRLLIMLWGVQRNVTEKTIAELALQEAHTQLEQRVKERTLDLNKANQELRELAYTLSHDLKSPLRSISTLSDWVYTDNMSTLDKQSLDNLKLIKSRVAVLYKLIEGIFNYSKIEGVTEKAENIDLNAIVSDVMSMLDIPKSITLVIENELPNIPISRIHMVQIFQNLISNAIKYNDKAQGLIQIGCRKLDKQFEFYVKDNGIGIDQKYFERVFKIFQTLESKQEADSTGIGLAIVNKIVEIYNGEIWIESKIGERTTFYFTLSI